MSKTKPVGGDTPQDFLDSQPFTVDVSAKVRQTNVDIARHNLQVTLKKVKEGCFLAAKKCLTEGKDHDAIKKMDDFVRKSYPDEPRKMAEWETLMQQYVSARGDDSP